MIPWPYKFDDAEHRRAMRRNLPMPFVRGHGDADGSWSEPNSAITIGEIMPLLLIILLVLLLGGGGGYYGYSAYGAGGGIGILGVVLIIALGVFLFGRGRR